MSPRRLQTWMSRNPKSTHKSYDINSSQPRPGPGLGLGRPRPGERASACASRVWICVSISSASGAPFSVNCRSAAMRSSSTALVGLLSREYTCPVRSILNSDAAKSESGKQNDADW